MKEYSFGGARALIKLVPKLPASRGKSIISNIERNVV